MNGTLSERQPEWHLDSWDARGGFAFASLFVDSTDEFAPGMRTVFISPPAFTPEAIANGAVALSASRGAFQQGFFLDGQSVAFPNLDDLVTFVRRVFLAGGGGDALGNDGPPGMPSEGGPDVPLRSELDGWGEGSPASRKFLDGCERFAKAADSRSIGSPGVPFSWSDIMPTSMTSSPPLEDPLFRASLLSLLEILRRWPQNKSKETLKWWRSVHVWLDAIHRLHLTEALSNTVASNAHVMSMLNAVARTYLAIQQVREESDWMFWLIQGTRAYDIINYSGCATQFDSLWRLPLPQHIRGCLSATGDADKDLSVGHLLSMSVASPTLLTNNRQAALDIADLVLFAAAVVAAPAAYPTSAHCCGYYVHADPVTDAVGDEIGTAAAGWLVRALPQLALPEKLEALIVEGATKAYA